MKRMMILILCLCLFIASQGNAFSFEANLAPVPISQAEYYKFDALDSENTTEYIASGDGGNIILIGGLVLILAFALAANNNSVKNK